MYVIQDLYYTSNIKVLLEMGVPRFFNVIHIFISVKCHVDSNTECQFISAIFDVNSNTECVIKNHEILKKTVRNGTCSKSMTFKSIFHTNRLKSHLNTLHSNKSLLSRLNRLKIYLYLILYRNVFSSYVEIYLVSYYLRSI